jgi:hypothetical protein
MIRFITRETYLGRVPAGGNPEITIRSFDNVEKLECFLRYEDHPGEKRNHEYMRELLGVELI